MAVVKLLLLQALQKGGYALDASSLFAPISGALVAAIVFAGQRRQARWKTTLDVIREFDSQSMLANRRNAYATIQKWGVVDLVNWRSDPSAPITGEEANLVWSILVYYERLWILIKNGQIAEKAILDAYGDNFYWWWEVCFRHVEIREGEATIKHLYRFKEWMDRRVIAEVRDHERLGWVADGREDWAAVQRNLQKHRDGNGGTAHSRSTP